MCCVRAQPRIYVSVMLCEHLNLYLRKCHYEKAEIALIYIPLSKHIRKLQSCDQVFSSVFINSLCAQSWTFPDLYLSNSCRENGDRPSDGIREVLHSIGLEGIMNFQLTMLYFDRYPTNQYGLWCCTVDIYTLFIHAYQSVCSCTASYACESDVVVWPFKLVPQEMSLWKGRNCVDTYSLLQAYQKTTMLWPSLFFSLHKLLVCTEINLSGPVLFQFVPWKLRRSTLIWYSVKYFIL